MAKLTMKQIESKEDGVEIRWQIIADDGSQLKNYFGKFPVGDQGAIDAAFKKSLAAYDFAEAIAQTYGNKVVSLDNKGDIKIEDKTVDAGIVEPG